MTATSIVWLQHDLRLNDNPALTAAGEAGLPVIPLFIWPPGQATRSLGPAAGSWLRDSAIRFDADLRARELQLVVRRGNAAEIIPALAGEVKAAAVHWNSCCAPSGINAENQLKQVLQRRGLEAHTHTGNLLLVPGTVVSKQGSPYKVFSAFHREFQRRYHHSPPLPEPERLAAPGRWPVSLALNQLTAGERDARTSQGSWAAGEGSALRRLDAFIAHGLAQYKENRDMLAGEGTSQLSPYLQAGVLSIRQVWHVVEAQLSQAQTEQQRSSINAFLRQLVWREFCYHTLNAFPAIAEHPLDHRYAEFPWEENRKLLDAWQNGETGYPVVDAAMRQLATTGWMHNRARMIVGSFLVKHLLQPWQAGEQRFWRQLIDADPACNAFGWQWVAGSGADAAPFFRIFNPVLQGKKYDKAGEYVRRFVPELSGLPQRFIHEPWTAPASVLQRSGVELGKNYARPAVEHQQARRRALVAYDLMKTGRTKGS